MLELMEKNKLELEYIFTNTVNHIFHQGKGAKLMKLTKNHVF